MFQKSKTYTAIKSQMGAINALDKYATFECYGDSVATFSFYHKTNKYELSFICDDIFLRDELISDLFELKRITFFSYRVFNADNERISMGHTWRVSDEE